MQTALSKIFRSTLATSVMALLLAAGVAHSTGTRQIEAPVLYPTPAEEAFADAPFGVDPVVTGPKSASFTEKQTRLGCESAVWPDVPLGCYPK